MQFTVIALMASTAMALPAITSFKFFQTLSDQPTPYTWTFEQFQRQCTNDGSQCTYTFNVNEDNGLPANPCQVTVDAADGQPAYRGDHHDLPCGPYYVNTHWNNTYGDNNGFTNLAVVRAPYICYPAYTDAELNPGTVVTPDHSPYPLFIAGN